MRVDLMGFIALGEFRHQLRPRLLRYHRGMRQKSLLWRLNPARHSLPVQGNPDQARSSIDHPMRQSVLTVLQIP